MLHSFALRLGSAVLTLSILPAIAIADTVELKITLENLAPTNSVAFAPLRLGIHGGTFDGFNNGEAAPAGIISVAEGGSGADWFPAFAAADPTATLGTVVPNPPGPLLPGASASAVFTVDPAVNPYFSFAAMVVPSNDVFIGNDSPTAYMLFDGLGNLNLTSITQRASDIWDAGSETTEAANAAFLAIGNNDLRTPQNGVVSFDFAGLSAFNGLTTGAGYVFDSQLTGNLDVYRISFSLVPEPSTFALVGLGSVALVAAGYRRRRS